MKPPTTAYTLRSLGVESRMDVVTFLGLNDGMKLNALAVDEYLPVRPCHIRCPAAKESLAFMTDGELVRALLRALKKDRESWEAIR